MAIKFSGDIRQFADDAFAIGNTGMGSAVTDGGSTLVRGSASTNSLSVVGGGPAARGTATIDGAGSSFVVRSGGQPGMGDTGLGIGFFGRGTVNVRDSGNLTLQDLVNDPAGNQLLTLGSRGGASGTLNLSGGSTLSINGFSNGVLVGDDGGRGTFNATASTINVVGRAGTDPRGPGSAEAGLRIGEDGGRGDVVLTGGTNATFRAIGDGDPATSAFAGALIGEEGGAGTLSVRGDSTLTFTADDDPAFLSVGRGDRGDPNLPRSNATLNVESNSVLNVASSAAGDGIGAFLDVGRDRAIATATVDGGTITVTGAQEAFGAIGRDGATGTLIVDGGGAVTYQQGLSGFASDPTAFRGAGLEVGSSGGTGTVDVRDGTLALLSEAGRASVTVGDRDGTGTLNVGDAGRLGIEARGGFENAFINVGAAGGSNQTTSGTFVVDGGTVEVDSANGAGFMSIGRGTGGVGVARFVNGADVDISGVAARVLVGASNEETGISGRLLVASGSDLTLTSTSGLAGDNLVAIGNDQGQTGRMTVTGAGATVNAAAFEVGASVLDPTAPAGDGTLTVTAGGRLNLDAMGVGRGGTLVTSGALIDVSGAVSGAGPDGAPLPDGLVVIGRHDVRSGFTTIVGEVTYGEGALATFRIDAGGRQGTLVARGAEAGIAFETGSRIVVAADSQGAIGRGEKFALAVTPGSTDAVTFGADFSLADDVGVSGLPADFGYSAFVDRVGSLFLNALTDGRGNGTALLNFGAGDARGARFTYDSDARAGTGQGGVYEAVGARDLDAVSGTASNDVLVANGANDFFLLGQAGRDTLVGTAGDDRLDGGAGNDRLFGRAGDDGLIGGAGDDVLTGGAGADVLSGGSGFDTASYELAGSGVTADMAVASAGRGEGAGDRFIAIERVVGSKFGDVLRGSGGDDRLEGARGKDVLVGRAGDDVLIGGQGDDVIAGGLGRDVLRGNEGADRFFYAAAAESIGASTDLIVDFERGVDRIDLSRLDGDATAPGNQPLAFVSGFTGAGGEVRTAAGSVLVDLDGDLAADLAIRLSGNPTLAADDFIL